MFPLLLVLGLVVAANAGNRPRVRPTAALSPTVLRALPAPTQTFNSNAPGDRGTDSQYGLNAPMTLLEYQKTYGYI